MAQKFPRFSLKVRQSKWGIILPVRRMKALTRAKMSNLHVDPYQVYWIPVDKITKSIYRQIRGVPNTAFAYGTVRGGDWDRNTLPIDQENIILSAKNRFVKGMEWQETTHYVELVKRISRGEIVSGCGNMAELDRYFQNFDRLFQSIKNNGYKRQSDLCNSKIRTKGPDEDEISVHIDRNGHYIFSNGAHRLSIALILGIKTIPVMVCIRHAKWQAFVNEIIAYSKKNNSQVYQPLTHPDLQSIPSAHAEKRFNIIKHHLSICKGTILDIGSHWGYFCQRFEDLGFDCYAVESAHEHAYFLDKLRIAEKKRFKIIQQSILEYETKHCFDIVLALNIFHHFLKTKNQYHKLIAFLQRTDMNTMFFEPHIISEKQMKNAFCNYKPDEFVQFILRHSCLNNAEIIGVAEDERLMYKLWK